MLVCTHPNADIGYIIINEKYHRLFTGNKCSSNTNSHYWLNKDNIIYNCGSAFAVLEDSSFHNLPNTLDRISFTARSIYPTVTETYFGVFYL